MPCVNQAEFAEEENPAPKTELETGVQSNFCLFLSGSSVLSLKSELLQWGAQSRGQPWLPQSQGNTCSGQADHKATRLALCSLDC